ncbi:MAG: bifunctional diaminohydroxyphosphoribosylaminopyrimidine deaminase/5-amino-6-(5-phosphoribosylamino)uracil reductase RibD [Pseudomonadota bacterium]
MAPARKRMARTTSSDCQSARDARFMDIALMLARRGLGTTAPNPAVGAVIVDETTGEVIARGWTQPGGRPHAETEALRRAGARARGATMYVTLEPCSHHGGTPPCADALVEAGIARVVVGIEDPDPRVAGRGLDRLRAAGISVTRGVRSAEADWVTRGHILRVSERRPFIQLKLALAADGSVPRGKAGQPVWVTGPEARAHGHLLRATADAILVGRRTVEDDDPELTCRLPGLAGQSPARVVLTRDLRISLESKLVRTARDVPVILFCGPDADSQQRAELEARGCEIIPVREVEGTLWLPAVTEALAARNVTRLLVEGGPAIWRSFARACFVDEVIAFQARAEQTREANRPPPSAYLPGLDLTLVARQEVGADVMMIYRRRIRQH